jgi:hypothetical protein
VPLMLEAARLESAAFDLSNADLWAIKWLSRVKRSGCR